MWAVRALSEGKVAPLCKVRLLRLADLQDLGVVSTALTGCCQPYQDIRARCSKRLGAYTEGGELPLAARAWLLPQLEESSHSKVKHPDFNAAPISKGSNAQKAPFAKSGS